MTKPVIAVENLTTGFHTEIGFLTAIQDISFAIEPGKTLAVVGESGCGKSVTANSIMRLVEEVNGKIMPDSKIMMDGTNLAALTDRQMRSIRGNKISMIFQEPMTALNPVYTVGTQLMEVFRLHQDISADEARRKSIEMLDQVMIPDPHKRIDEYPFQMSGGMRQRVVIAIALACRPDLLIADEPTTALDVTIQAQILELLNTLQKQRGTAILFITHDLGVVAEVADEVMVMYAGRCIERGAVVDIFKRPKHPYTVGLMNSLPRLEQNRHEPLQTIPGNVPTLSKLPAGCRYHPRCPKVFEPCRSQIPGMLAADATGTETMTKVACHLYGPNASQGGQ